MNKIMTLVHKVLMTPPNMILKKIYNKTDRKILNYLQRKKDLSNDTHISIDMPWIKNSYIQIKQLDICNIDNKVAQYLSSMYRLHRFDLLGSGWIKNSYDSVPLGVEGYRYDMNILSPRSESEEYEPIDWQKDYKSGFRWDEKKWYKDQRIGHKVGMDIKVPWELARMQHLPQLSLFALVDNKLIDQNIKEFKYQVLDFIENNPPRMGANWVCTMDVGIRAANLLVAYDLFLQMDENDVLDNDFKQIFANSIYEHGLHIIKNLEYSEKFTSNHYLSDIAGLLFVSAYLESNDEVDQWLAFSVQEIISEMRKQFYADGGNFESSTNYHRLSGELMVFCTALMMGLKKEKVKSLQKYNYKKWKIKPKLLPLDKQEFSIDTQKFIINLPQWYIDRLFKAGRLTVDLTKPSGEIPQIGDNDSGRFFRFSPNGVFVTNTEAEKKYFNLRGYNALVKTYIQKDELYWDENILDHSTFISAFGGLYEEEIFKNNVMLENSIIASIAKRKLIAKDKLYIEPVILGKKIDALPFLNEIIHIAQSTFDNLKQISYPDSGIYIFKADNLHLTFCATPLGQNGNGGHTHNDKLSYELWLDRKDIIKDPGTYLYTPLPDRRNEFRSIKAHNVPLIDNLEQKQWNEGVNGLFHMRSTINVEILNLGINTISMYLRYKDVKIKRIIIINEFSIVVTDFSNKQLTYFNDFKFSSNGYGKIYEKK